MSFLAAVLMPQFECAADRTFVQGFSVQGFSRGFGREFRPIEQVAGPWQIDHFPDPRKCSKGKIKIIMETNRSEKERINEA